MFSGGEHPMVLRVCSWLWAHSWQCLGDHKGHWVSNMVVCMQGKWPRAVVLSSPRDVLIYFPKRKRASGVWNRQAQRRGGHQGLGGMELSGIFSVGMDTWLQAFKSCDHPKKNGRKKKNLGKKDLDF